MNKEFLVIVGTAAMATTASAAHAADLPVKAPVYEAASISSTPNWTGFYVGGNVGYAFGNTNVVLSPSPNFLMINPSPQMYDFIRANGASMLRSSGFDGGFQAGYKAQIGPVLLGAEADWSYLELKKSTATGILPLPDGMNTISYSQASSTTQMVTLRGIIGAPVGRFLPYVTGGLGVGSDRFSQMIELPTGPGPCFCWTGQASRAQPGWVVGAGIEYAITARVSAKMEYVYTDFGSLQFTTLGEPNGVPGLDFTHSAAFIIQTVKAGLNFRL